MSYFTRLHRSAAFALVLAVVMTFGLYGCSNGNTDSATSTTSASSNTDTQSTSSTEASASAAPDYGGPFGKYDSGITLTSVHYVEADAKYTNPGDTEDNNLYTRAVKENLGITIKYDWVTAVDQYDTKLQLAVANDNLPDFFLVRDPKMYYDLAAAGKIQDLSDVFDKYASNSLKAVSKAQPGAFDQNRIDGKLYGMPVMGDGALGSPDVLWIRTDWLKEAGLSAPTTAAELENVALTFMKNHPGSYGVGLYKDLFGMQGLTQMNHGIIDMWYHDDTQNKIVYGSVQEGMKNTLAMLQGWYKKGIVDPEFTVKDFWSQGFQNFIDGKCGIIFGPQFLGGWPFTDAYKKSKAEFAPFPIPSVDGAPVYAQTWATVDKFWVVSSKSKHPEALIKLLNEQEKVITNTDKKSIPNYYDEKPKTQADIPKGYVDTGWESYPAFYTNPGALNKQVDLLWPALEKQDFGYVEANSDNSEDYKNTYDAALSWLKDKNPDGIGAYTSLASLDIVNRTLFQPGRIIKSAKAGPDPEVLKEKGSTLKDLCDQTFLNIISGKQSIDTFDKFVQDWNKAGGQEATDAVNQLYNRN